MSDLENCKSMKVIKPQESCPLQRHCAFLEIEAETLLLLLSGFVLYMASCQLLNWVIVYCSKILLPYSLLTFLYILASVFLFFGVVCSVRVLIKIFVVLMILSLFADVAYVVMIYIDQRCLCNQLHWLTKGFQFYISIVTVYPLLYCMAGANFVVSLVSVLAVIDYLKANPKSD